jgi:xylulokinase
MSADLYLGLDLGTSGARALLIDDAGEVVASGKAGMREQGPNPRDPRVWLSAAEAALRGALAGVDPERIAALCVDGTSGTVLAVDALGRPLGEGLMYNDAAEPAGVLAVAESAPDVSAAHGSTSGLAKAMQLRALKPNRVLHQADWIASRFSGRFVSDANNALKTGYDPIASRWPDWIGELGFNLGLLPEVLAPGQVVGTVTREAAEAYGLFPRTRVVAGTTDGCASFLATGAAEVGDAVTALGTTLTLKLLSDRPIFSPSYGIYSHRLLGMWLAGGASNSGGGALLSHFSPAEMEALTPSLDPDQATGLDYYPLSKPGERFPINDPAYPPRLSPRPETKAQFLQGLFEGVAAIEALGYARLAELGAPKLKSVRAVGGGAKNPAWTRIRARVLGVPTLTPRSDEAAYGAALLARAGA